MFHGGKYTRKVPNGSNSALRIVPNGTILEVMKETLEQIRTMLQPDFDWGTYWEGDGERVNKLFRQCAKVIPNSELDAWYAEHEQYDAGSAEVKDTPKVLYRALWLLGPKGLDFDDMYKNLIFVFATPDNRFSVRVEFYKYEVGLYFCAPKDCIAGSGRGVVCGFPGVDNGWKCSDELGRLFFEVSAGLLNSEHTIYAGNDFKV